MLMLSGKGWVYFDTGKTSYITIWLSKKALEAILGLMIYENIGINVI